MNNIDKYLKKITATACINQSDNLHPVGTVEIIVPVYQAFKAVKKCIQALIQHTNPEHLITVLDDASNDQQLTDYLQQISTEHNHIKLITRKHNLGYLDNINQHLAQCNHAVVLLNSDTTVTANWLTHLQETASDSRVGAVCPLSNNATLLSLPGLDTKQIKDLNDLSGLWFPIPTAVGFCMLIKAGLWQQLGGFDRYYDPGYGEECDFSMLMRAQNLQVACTPAAYVYHQGSQSFKKQSNTLQQQHQQLLDLRWPLYEQEIKKFSNLNPVQWVKQWLLSRTETKPRILHLVHGIDSKGGVELFTSSLLQAFDDQYHHTLLVMKKGPTKTGGNHPFELIILDVDAFHPDHVIFNSPADLYHSQLDTYFSQLLHWSGFSYVHFHSRVGIGTAIWPQICAQLDIPYAFFFHDHSGLCQIFSLSNTINKQEIFCGKDRALANDHTCQKCIQNKSHRSRLTPESYLSLRQQIWQLNLDNAKHLQFCSDYLFNSYSRTYPNIKTKSQKITPSFIKSQINATKPMPQEKITVAFLGQFGVLKGVQLFIDLYHQMDHENIVWKIIGGIDPQYQPQLKQTDIVTVGSYQTDGLSDLLQHVDIIAFTSQIPETYGITLTEAMANAIPVVAPNLGAYTSRVKQQHNGLLYEANNINSLVTAIKQLIAKQQSTDRIEQIEYQADCIDAASVLQHSYATTIKSNKHNNLKPLSGTALLPAPKTSAYQTMQLWLEAPMTLEANADWQQATTDMDVLILGTDAATIEQTQNNLRQHLAGARLHTTTALQNLAEAKLLLIIQAGNLINENIGNWQQHMQQNDIACIADFALHNKGGQNYAPQFMGAFSWQNLANMQANIGCILLKPCGLDELKLQDFWSKQLKLQHILTYLHQHHPKQVAHFPYFSYTMADHHYAQHWKQQSFGLFASKSPIPQNIHVLVRTELSGQALSKLQHMYQQQKWGPHTQVHHHFYPAQQNEAILTPLENINAAVFLLSDNLKLTDENALFEMIKALYCSHLDALSIAAARDVFGHFLVAKKAGAANHIQGIGQIKDLRFTQPDAVHEWDWLDDDFSLFNAQAWQAVAAIVSQDSSLFTAIKLSAALINKGLSIGIKANTNIYKKGLPSIQLDDKPIELNKQRQNVIDAGQHVPQHSHFPKAFSCRQGMKLDLSMTSFKTPKRLPRVLAYAQDDWASGFYRVKSPLNALAAEDKISVHFIATINHQVTPTPYEIFRMQADVLLLHGFYADQQLVALNQYKKQLNLKIIISIDDLLTDIPDYNPFTKRIPKDINTRIKMACGLADALVVSTAELADKFSSYHPNIKIIPNHISQHIWPSKTVVRNDAERLRVGWAGAGQHQGDLAWLAAVVEKTKGFCDWVFFGDKPNTENADDFEFHPPVSLIEYPKKIQQLNLDLGVAPLIDNAFNRAKSSLKLLEYGVLGMPVLASNLPCYQASPATLLENDVDQWVQKLNDYHQDRAMLQHHGLQMQSWVHKNHWLEHNTDQWLDLLSLSS